MWKLKTAQGEGLWLTSSNNYIGRQHWEYDEEGGTLQERAIVDEMRQNFTKNRFLHKQSSDLLMRMQVCLLLRVHYVENICLFVTFNTSSRHTRNVIVIIIIIFM